MIIAVLFLLTHDYGYIVNDFTRLNEYI